MPLATSDTHLGISYIPTGLLARSTTQCIDPDSGECGSWLFVGGDHRKPGARISPVFSDLLPFFKWADENGWDHVLGCYGTYKKL